MLRREDCHILRRALDLNVNDEREAEKEMEKAG